MDSLFIDSGFIKHIQTYTSLSKADLTYLTLALKPTPIKKKEYLLKEGQVCKEIHFVEKGCLRLFFINEKGTEQTTQFALENWWISDYMSFDRQNPSTFYIQAVENSEITSLDSSLQEDLIKKIPQLEKYFRLMLQKAFAASQIRIKYLYELSKEDSYQQFISLYPGFVQRIPQYMLASYLGFTPEYLSELRHKLKK